jgi:hypothetical protein
MICVRFYKRANCTKNVHLLIGKLPVVPWYRMIDQAIDVFYSFNYMFNYTVVHTISICTGMKSFSARPKLIF